MCTNHDQLHYDWRARAIAGNMAGLDRVQPDLAQKARKTRDLLLRQATIIGLLDCLDNSRPFVPESKRDMFRVKLLALSAECQAEALKMLQSTQPVDDDVPF